MEEKARSGEGGRLRLTLGLGRGVAGVWRMENAGMLVQIILTSRVPALPCYKPKQ